MSPIQGNPHPPSKAPRAAARTLAPDGWSDATRIIAVAALDAWNAKFAMEAHRLGFCNVTMFRLYPSHWRRAPRLKDYADPCPGCALTGYTTEEGYSTAVAREELLDLLDETIAALRLTGYHPPKPTTPPTAAPPIVPTYHDRLHNVYPEPSVNPYTVDGEEDGADYSGATGRE